MKSPDRLTVLAFTTALAASSGCSDLTVGAARGPDTAGQSGVPAVASAEVGSRGYSEASGQEPVSPDGVSTGAEDHTTPDMHVTGGVCYKLRC